MKQQRIGVVASARADRARHRGGDAAAEPAVRHHGHQHEDREHQRCAGERVGAEKADIIGFRDVHRGLRHQHGYRRQRELEQGGQDRSGQQRRAGLIGPGTCGVRGLARGRHRCGRLFDTAAGERRGRFFECHDTSCSFRMLRCPVAFLLNYDHTALL